jgi:hypothetical protein
MRDAEAGGHQEDAAGESDLEARSTVAVEALWMSAGAAVHHP